MRVHLAYGKEGLNFNLPDDLHIDVVEPKYEPGLADQKAAVAEALDRPIGSRPLAERVGEGAEVVLFNATGTHRPNSEGELVTILGEQIARDYPIVQNDSSDEGSHVRIGTTSRGNVVSLHREFLDCELKILTGFIEPHFFAGFSGGGKAVMPGLAQLETIQRNHGAAHIDNDQARWGGIYPGG